MYDDCGHPVEVPRPVRGVVSLVPSLTEAVETTAPGLIVGATDWCTQPPDLQVRRIGGTKNPRVDDVVVLAPDLVVANEEENRASDIDELRARGMAVWVTAPRSVADALHSLDRMLRLGCGLPRPHWLDDAQETWSVADEHARAARAVVPIWRRPWMALGHDTFAGDVLARLGVTNALRDAVDRYPRVNLDEVAALQPDLVVLPDEPYPFGRDDGPEAFASWDARVACVSGRHLTWYGPSLVAARSLLSAQLDAAR
jgi:ABC-type Fe3+-hydroxamate transport system substrate-binding protein